MLAILPDQNCHACPCLAHSSSCRAISVPDCGSPSGLHQTRGYNSSQVLCISSAVLSFPPLQCRLLSICISALAAPMLQPDECICWQHSKLCTRSRAAVGLQGALCRYSIRVRVCVHASGSFSVDFLLQDILFDLVHLSGTPSGNSQCSSLSAVCDRSHMPAQGSMCIACK